MCLPIFEFFVPPQFSGVIFIRAVLKNNYHQVGHIKWETGGNLGEDIIKQMQESMETNDITMQESMKSEEEESQMPEDGVQEELSLDEEDLMDMDENLYK